MRLALLAYSDRKSASCTLAIASDVAPSSTTGPSSKSAADNC